VQVWLAVNELLEFYELWKKEKPDSLKDILAKLPNFKKYLQDTNNMNIVSNTPLTSPPSVKTQQQQQHQRIIIN
jgi:hypothetical protein